MFLSDDRPEKIVKLLESYPEFRPIYQEIYDLCRNVERVMEMFSKELMELDRNTVQYMIDEMQDEIDAKKAKLQEQDVKIQEQEAEIKRLKAQLQGKI